MSSSNLSIPSEDPEDNGADIGDEDRSRTPLPVSQNEDDAVLSQLISAPPFRASMPSPAPQGAPTAIGRYRVIRELGKGGFGRVYLAHDDQLARHVAVKVPNPERVACPDDIEAYLAEARTLASLDHPHIVPVYDAGRTDDGICYLISKYVEGIDLYERMRHGRLTFREAAEVAATVAEALHHAHTRGLVHRDVKPANILLDTSGRPCVADFGLALKDEDYGKGARLTGTPAYMSPEQARKEGHRVDGRSDVFSLGVVFYESLTGQRPFRRRGKRPPRADRRDRRPTSSSTRRFHPQGTGADLPQGSCQTGDRSLSDRLRSDGGSAGLSQINQGPDRRPAIGSRPGSGGHANIHRRPAWLR